MIGDFALAVKDALRAADPAFDATLEVDDDLVPAPGSPVVLVADDGGPALIGGAWLFGASPRRPTLRLTAIGTGRTEVRNTVIAAAEWVAEHKPGITRVEDLPAPLITRDRKTGADLASIAMPIIVRQTV